MSYLDALECAIGDNVHMGHFNRIRGLRKLKIGNQVWISNFNDAMGTGEYYAGWPVELRIGNNVNIMSRHTIDVAGTVSIGDGCTLAGRDTHLWSHSVFVTEEGTKLMPMNICIGNHVYVGARSTILGVTIPARAMVGAGAVVTKSFPAEPGRILIAGNPAGIRKRYPPVSAPAANSPQVTPEAS